MTDDANEICESLQTVQIVALNRRLRWACYSIRTVALAWILWGLAIYVVIWWDRSDFLGRLSKFNGVDPAAVTDFGYGAACAITFVSWAAAAIFVRYLWNLTRVYLEGRVFSIEAAKRMRSLALAGFAAVPADIAVRPLVAKLPPLAWFSPEDLLYLRISGFTLALSVIFRTAAEIASEHAQLV